MKYDIFISYSNIDEVIANDVCCALENGGFQCWMAPRNIQPGKPYAREIINGINSSSMILLIFTSNSNKSEHVITEVDRAFNSKKTIIPFLVEDVAMNEELDYYLARKQWFVAYPQYKSRLSELITTLAEILHSPDAVDEVVGEDTSIGSWQEVKKSAEQGNADAQWLLGNYYYYEGDGVPQSYSEAVKWYRKSAEQGNADAQYGLGLCYYEGNGVSQSYSEAVKWWRRAAEQGDAVAQSRLGLCYYEGNGVPQSYSEAVKWWRRAAEQGDAYAQYGLGLCYYEGEGVPQSYSEAVKWYRRAADQGCQDAKDALKRLGY